MRGYHVWYPGKTDYFDHQTYWRLRDIPDLPDGSRVEAFTTERDGSPGDAWNIPVVKGRPRARGRTIYGKGTLYVRGPRAGTVKR